MNDSSQSSARLIQPLTTTSSHNMMEPTSRLDDSFYPQSIPFFTRLLRLLVMPSQIRNVSQWKQIKSTAWRPNTEYVLVNSYYAYLGYILRKIKYHRVIMSERFGPVWALAARLIVEFMCYDYYGSLNLDWVDTILYTKINEYFYFSLGQANRSFQWGRWNKKKFRFTWECVNTHGDVKRRSAKVRFCFSVQKNIWIKSKKYDQCSPVFAEAFITLSTIIPNKLTIEKNLLPQKFV